MKKVRIYKPLALLAVAVMFITGCTKDTSDVRLDPQLATSRVINITSSTATVIGFVVAEGDGFTEKGICYDIAADPTVASNKTAYSQAGTKATFNVTLTGLDYATKYYARAYAIGPDGTVYGEEVSFTTAPVVPTVVTGEFEATSGTSAAGGGEVTVAGGADVTERGVCYSKNHNPTISDSKKKADDAGLGEFTSSLTNLKGLTTYYVRAYATNSAGTGYGEEVSFTTPEAIVVLYAAGDFQGWNPGGATDSIMNSADDPIVQGYVYLPNSNGFKFTSQKNWDGPNYGAGATAGTLSTDPGAGNLSVSEAGYYLFKLDLATMTYTAIKTDWGVVGSAVGSWDDDQNMTYSIVLKRWFATIPLTADVYKFRANDGWDINYGDNAPANGTLEPGGNDIPCATAGTYSVMMNLSSPLNYNYALTTWGIIGTAAGGWGDNDDIEMVPSSDNTWTVTTDLATGAYKFRANHGWTINLGGTTDALSFGGSDLSIATAGNYTVTLDLVSATCTVTMN